MSMMHLQPPILNPTVPIYKQSLNRNLQRTNSHNPKSNVKNQLGTKIKDRNNTILSWGFLL